MINAHSWFYCNKQILKLSFLFLYFGFLASGNTVAHVNTFVIQEIRHAFSCLLQNILQSGQMMFEIEKVFKPRILYFKQHFSTPEVILQQTQKRVLYLYSTMATKYC